MTSSSQTSEKFGWLPLVLALVIAVLWAVVPSAQASSGILGAAPAYDQGSALLVGIMGVLYLVRRRRRR